MSRTWLDTGNLHVSISCKIRGNSGFGKAFFVIKLFCDVRDHHRAIWCFWGLETFKIEKIRWKFTWVVKCWNQMKWEALSCATFWPRRIFIFLENSFCFAAPSNRTFSPWVTQYGWFCLQIQWINFHLLVYLREKECHSAGIYIRNVMKFKWYEKTDSSEREWDWNCFTLLL